MRSRDFMFNIGDHIDNQFLHATITDRYKDDSGRKTYDLICDNCGCKITKTEYLVEKGSGCGVCAGRVVVKGVNDIPTTAPWMVPYFPGGEEEASKYTQSSGKSFIPICPLCGRLSDIETSPNNVKTHHGISCICKDGISIPNKIIYALMEQSMELGLITSYEKEHKEYDEKNILRKFDMLFCDLSKTPYFVEMDGGFHGHIIKEHSKEKIVAISARKFYPDIMKDNIASKLNIPLIRIDCYKSDMEYIKNNIVNSKISELIDLTKIKWDKIEMLCFNSVMVDVCEYKAKNQDSSSKYVANIFNISESAVRIYWNRGTKIGLCNYNPKQEGKKWMKERTVWKHGIPIVLEDVDSGKIWKFDTISEFARMSKEIIGTRLSEKMINNRFRKTNSNYFNFVSETDEIKYKVTKISKENE